MAKWCWEKVSACGQYPLWLESCHQSIGKYYTTRHQALLVQLLESQQLISLAYLVERLALQTVQLDNQWRSPLVQRVAGFALHTVQLDNQWRGLLTHPLLLETLAQLGRLVFGGETWG